MAGGGGARGGRGLRRRSGYGRERGRRRPGAAGYAGSGVRPSVLGRSDGAGDARRAGARGRSAGPSAHAGELGRRCGRHPGCRGRGTGRIPAARRGVAPSRRSDAAGGPGELAANRAEPGAGVRRDATDGVGRGGAGRADDLGRSSGRGRGGTGVRAQLRRLGRRTHRGFGVRAADRPGGADRGLGDALQDAKHDAHRVRRRKRGDLVGSPFGPGRLGRGGRRRSGRGAGRRVSRGVDFCRRRGDGGTLLGVRTLPHWPGREGSVAGVAGRDGRGHGRLRVLRRRHLADVVLQGPFVAGRGRGVGRLSVARAAAGVLQRAGPGGPQRPSLGADARAGRRSGDLDVPRLRHVRRAGDGRRAGSGAARRRIRRGRQGLRGPHGRNGGFSTWSGTPYPDQPSQGAIRCCESPDSPAEP